MAKITVYRFTNFNVMTRETILSTEYATRETITGLGGVPINKTVTEIDDSLLNKYSFYIPPLPAECDTASEV
jgi:hypothetical protein